MKNFDFNDAIGCMIVGSYVGMFALGAIAGYIFFSYFG